MATFHLKQLKSEKALMKARKEAGPTRWICEKVIKITAGMNRFAMICSFAGM